jgi:hypothetical protein
MGSATPIRQVNSQQLAAIRQLLGTELQNWVNEAYGSSVPLITRDLIAADLVSGNIPSLYNQVAGLGSSTAGTPGYVGILGASPGIVTGGASLASGVWTTPTFGPLPNNQAIGIWGVADVTPSPTLVNLQFLVGVSTLFDQVSLEYAYASGEPGVIMDPPQVWKPTELLNMKGNFNSTVAAGGENIIMLGTVCEPTGRTITPREVPVSR